MEVLGLDPAEMSSAAINALIGTTIIFFVISPIGGFFLFRLLRDRLPPNEVLLVLLGAGVELLETFALTLLLLDQVLDLEPVPMLVISLVAALGFTAATAAMLTFILRRDRAHSHEDHSFSVWDEDRRKRPRKR